MIQVVVDDLAFLDVDAVLRPASDRLDPATPMISRLDELAGERFTAQRRIQQPLVVGAAVVTGAGDLTAKFVVHAVIQSPQTPADADTVRRALISAWQRAADWELASMATPLVGTGAGQLSLEEAAQLLEQTSRMARFPSRLLIVVNNENERTTVQAVVTRHPS
ncbi:MAG: macro domain-containing protein [Gemmatimonadota bacterium]